MKNIIKLFLLTFILLANIGGQDAHAATKTDGHLIGYSKAPVTLEIWESFSDPFGLSFQSTVEKLQKDYGDKINLVYKPFPLEQLFPIDILAAHASECASKYGFYEEFRDYMFSSEGRTDLSNGVIDGDGSKYFTQSGYLKCLDKDNKTYISKYLKEGKKKDISGVPTTFAIRNKDKKEIGIAGAQVIDSVRAVIDDLLIEENLGSNNKQNISLSDIKIEYPGGSDLGSQGQTKEMKITATIKNNEYGPLNLSGEKAKYTIYLYDVTSKNKKIAKVATGEVLIPYRNGYSEFSAYIEMGQPFDGKKFEKDYQALIKIKAPKSFKESSTKDNSAWSDSWLVTYYKG